MANYLTIAYYDSTLTDWVIVPNPSIRFSDDPPITTAPTDPDFLPEILTRGSAQSRTYLIGFRNETVEANNVAYVSSTQFALNGGSTETLNDTNLVASECTLRIQFYDDSSNISLSSVTFWVYQGSEATLVSDCEIYAFEQGESNSAWTKINDSATAVGGSGDALSLANNSGATHHEYYIALSMVPKAGATIGDIDFNIGIKATIA